MKNVALLGCLCALAVRLFSAEEELPPKPAVKYLSAAEELKTFQLPEGYSLELVLDENSIREPVVCAFDGNGRMYVCEFRSYMQDIDGTNELTNIGAVTRHESSRHNGIFDKHTIYADKLLLPRMVLPLDNRVLINETDTNDIYMYQDSKGDGVSDKKDLWFAGGKRGGNLEHQQSGLVWGLDNWMYQAVNSFRLRYAGPKEPLKENTPGNGGQWGLGMNNYGKMWFCNAGGERGEINFQVPIIYGAIELPRQEPADYLEVYPLVGLSDVQGGDGRHRADGTLNHMTASCGAEVVRVDRLPADIRGDSLIGEPVGRLVRRAKVEDHEGMTFIHNAYDKTEFIRSTDPNFRPINFCNGPDGCMYMVDMYRGIIQEGNWVKPGSYLRKYVKQNSLQNNFGRGRIWRLRHTDFQPGEWPHMLDETPAQLVAHLEHPNGWWRDTAQKLLVVKGDKSVVPALVEMAKNSREHLGKIHALWTLEGLDALDAALVSTLLKDAHPQVRIAAIRAGEGLIKTHPELAEQVKALTADPDANVVVQVALTAKYLKWPDFNKIANSVFTTTKFEGTKEIVGKLLHDGPTFDRKRFNKAEIARLEHGEQIFRELCYSCHGHDGKGMSKDMMPATVKVTGKATGTTIAPALAGSATVYDRDSMLRVLMKGMTGPANNKTYDAEMISMESNSDEWIADVASYVRNSFGNHGSMVTWADSARIRSDCKERGEKKWTQDEIRALAPKTLSSQGKWKLTASHNSAGTGAAIDGDNDTRWDTRTAMVPGMWFQMEFPEPLEVGRILLNQGASSNDYPRGYKVTVSSDGKAWGKPILEGKGTPGVTEINLKPTKTKFLRIEQTGSQPGTFWSIHELQLFPPGAETITAESGVPKKRLLAVSIAMNDRAASIPAAEKVLAEIAEHSGAFAVDFLRQPGPKPKDAADKWTEAVTKSLAQKFAENELKKYDGVIFLNTQGDLPLPNPTAFAEWIKKGKAFIGVSSAADTLHGCAPYVEMLGGEYSGQAWDEPVKLKIEDRKHPASAVYPTRFELSDKVLQFKNWKREAVHPVISVDPSNAEREKKDGKSFFERGTREDKDYAVAWTREYGNGRVFYTALGSAIETWNDARFQQHLFGGIKWALSKD